MNKYDLLVKNIPLKIGDEVVEGIYIKEAPLSELAKLQNLVKEKDLGKKLDMALSLIEICVVDKDGKCPFTTENKLSNNYILEVVNQVVEVNIPQGK